MPKIDIEGVVERKGSLYPDPFRNLTKTRIRQRLGEAAGLSDFGVNLVRLPPGEWSSQRHWHTDEEELIYVLEGELTMVTDAGEEIVRAGECAAFPKATPDAHNFINRSKADAVYLEIGSRHDRDVTHYPDIDLHFADHTYTHKDGRPY